ncbi:hypothetical protein FQR65_LT03750 [Abscondita terminalis]|nr:hypothetical protein FQR65_LT03750 [Abscondita terminalis]
MLIRVLLIASFCVLRGQCYFGIDNVRDNPFTPPQWNWKFFSDLYGSESQKSFVEDRSDDSNESEREPLGPDYKDPIKPKDELPKPKPAPPTKRPTFDSSVIPDGVVDVDASGFEFPQNFPEIPDTFGFTSTFGNGNPDNFFGLGGIFGPFAEPKRWWKGDNVCIEREETTDDEDSIESKQNDTEIGAPNFFSTSISLSNCQETPSKYECVTKINNHGVVKTFQVRYKCCYGYQKSDDSTGCTKKVVLVPLLNTIEEIGAKELKNMIHATGLDDKFINENLTVFAPTDDSMNQFTDKMIEMNQVDLHVPDAVRRRRQIKNPVSSKDLVLSHAVPGFVDLSEINNEDVMSTAYNTNIRFNLYPTRGFNKMLTANCVPVRKGDNLATNGIVHVIDGVLHPIKDDILTILEEHPQLSNFRTVFKNSNLAKNIKLEGHYTIFAPTDEAFNQLGESTRERLLRGDACAGTILKHHVVAHTVCSSAIVGNATTHSVDGELLNLQRTDEDVLLFEDKAKIIKTDIMGTNGVIHLIDAVIVPESALYITQSLKKENFTKFQALLEKVGLSDELDGYKNVTVFAPSDAAFTEPKSARYLEKIKDDKEKLREIVMYHIVDGQTESCDMNNNVLLKSRDNQNTLRLNLYSTLPVFSNIINRATVNCARLTGFDEKSCGSIIHEVNSILVPPSKNLLDLINEDEKYSTLSELLKGTDLETILKDSTQSLTFLAPSNEAFAKIDSSEMKNLMDDKRKASQLLKNHILTEILCCSGVPRQAWGFNNLIHTLGSQHQSAAKFGDDIRIGGATVAHCDDVATNGVIHTINKVLYPQQSRTPTFQFLFF